jgi:hypothetical protein
MQTIQQMLNSSKLLRGLLIVKRRLVLKKLLSYLMMVCLIVSCVPFPASGSQNEFSRAVESVLYAGEVNEPGAADSNNGHAADAVDANEAENDSHDSNAFENTEKDNQLTNDTIASDQNTGTETSEDLTNEEEPAVEDPTEAEEAEPAELMSLLATAFDDDFMHDDPRINGFKQKPDAGDLHDYKYFKIYEQGTNTIIGEGTIGGTASYQNPLVPLEGKSFVLEFLNEQTQEIRLELRDENKDYLGLIAFGTAEGQWGVLDGPQWHFHDTETGEIKPVGNYKIWDGKYWDTNALDFLYPGEVDGEIAPGEYIFYIRFQPISDSTSMYTVDIPIIISYTEEAIEALKQLRNLFEDLDCDGDPISMISGNFTWDYTDIAVNGAQTLEFTRYYNALDDKDGELSYGWRHNYMYSLNQTRVFASLTLPNGYIVQSLEIYQQEAAKIIISQYHFMEKDIVLTQQQALN